MRPDCRRLLLVLALAPACVAPAHADDAGRYALSASRDGFVRLDTATGAVDSSVLVIQVTDRPEGQRASDKVAP